jgi:hypothetical protein
MAEEDTEETTTPVILASLEDFRAIDLPSILGGLDRADDHAIETALNQAAEVADGDGRADAARAYRLLMFVCTFHLRVEDRAEAFGPRWRSETGRSYIPSDFRGEQNQILATVMKDIAHPALRARIADVVWYNDRKQGAAAALAIAAYCQVVRNRLDGIFIPHFGEPEDVTLDLVDLVHRALQIVALSRKRGEMPKSVEDIHAALYQRALERSDFVPFVRLADLGLSYGLLDWPKAGADAEHMAENAPADAYAMAIQAAWDLAAKAHGRSGDDEAKKRCQGRSVDQTLCMREQVGQASAKAYWTRKAIGELRAARGFKDRIATLRAELRDLQDESLDEFGQFSIPLDLSVERQGTIELFGGLTLPDILLQFAILARSVSIEDLHKQALESRKTSILSSLFGGSYSDHEGKIIAQTPAGPFEGEPDENWFKEKSLQYLDIWRNQVVGGFIDPARQTVMGHFPLEERHFDAIIAHSPFIPPGHEHLFALGFARFFQGDDASAAHLLIPQLENSLRYALLNAAEDSSKMKPDLLQEDRSLSGLLESMRTELERIFGVDVIYEIDLLFTYRPGPALRHEMAHGKMSAGACYHPSAVYACWLIYRLTCLPLLRHWKTLITPAIEISAL